MMAPCQVPPPACREAAGWQHLRLRYRREPHLGLKRAGSGGAGGGRETHALAAQPCVANCKVAAVEALVECAPQG